MADLGRGSAVQSIVSISIMPECPKLLLSAGDRALWQDGLRTLDHDMATVTHATGRGMPPKLDKNAPSGRINIVASETLIRRMDKQRAEIWPIPTKSETARVMIDQVLDLIERDQSAREEFQARIEAERKRASDS